MNYINKYAASGGSVRVRLRTAYCVSHACCASRTRGQRATKKTKKQKRVTSRRAFATRSMSLQTLQVLSRYIKTLLRRYYDAIKALLRRY